jgi:Glyoxalase-like domain
MHSDINRFYSILLGWQVQEPLATPGVRLFAEVDDLDEHVTLAQELGGTLVSPPACAGGARFAFVKDPAGHLFGLAHGLPTPEAWSIVQHMIDGTKRQRAEYDARLASQRREPMLAGPASPGLDSPR